MNKKSKSLLTGALVLALTLSIVVPQESVRAAKSAKKIALSNKKITLVKGKKKTVKIKNAKGKKVKWSIKKKSIAKIKKKGKYAVRVTAKKKGKTTLVCKYKKGKKWKKLTCKVVVNNKKTTKKKDTKVSAKPSASASTGLTDTKATPTPIPTSAVTPTPTPTSMVKDASFDTGNDGFAGRGDATIAVVDGGYSGKALYVQGRTNAWNGAGLPANKIVSKAATYHFVAWVKQESGSTQTMKLSAQIDKIGSATSYEGIASVECASGVWTKLEGDYVVPLDFTSLLFYFESAEGTFDFYVDELTIEQTKEGVDPMSFASIKDAYADVFPRFGNVVAYNQTWNNRTELQDEATMQFFQKQFNSFTLENEMKPSFILPANSGTLSVAQAEEQGYIIPEGYTEETVPRLSFDTLDAAIEKADEYGIPMRAHVLMWHQQTATRFFKTGYSDSGEVVEPEIMDKRLELYVKTVMYHVFEKEKELTGEAGSIVYCWDITNEYLHRDNAADKPSWVEVYDDMGLRPTYVKLAYQCAYAMLKEYEIEDTVTLFYNDYNEYEVADDLVKLVEYINEGEEANICGGIGMQSHITIEYPTLDTYSDTLDKFLATGLEVQVTELDMGIDDGLTEEDQAEHYKKIMALLVKKQRERDTSETKGITGVTIWGLYDSVSWRTDSPLLFGSSIIDPKPAFEAMFDALSEE